MGFLNSPYQTGYSAGFNWGAPALPMDMGQVAGTPPVMAATPGTGGLAPSLSYGSSAPSPTMDVGAAAEAILGGGAGGGAGGSDFGLWGKLGLWDQSGLNWDTVQGIGQGVGALGNMWNAWQQNRLARDQFDFTKEAYNTNLDNQVQTYNTSLEDRTKARNSYLGRPASDTRAYMASHRLTR